jgi:hypothetical protein
VARQRRAEEETVKFWYDQRAACRGADIDIFFKLSVPANKEMALALCQACRVRPECLAASMREETGIQRFGIRGGLTADERRALVKKRSYERKRDAKTRAA